MTEWHASDYNRQSALQLAMAEEQLRLLTLRGDERVLDVGCGDGKITAEIAARAPRGSVLGVDPSRDMIDFAACHFGAPAHPNLHFGVADVRHLPYRGEFDLVVSFNALHWVPEQDLALGSIRAALAPGGQFLGRFVSRGERTALEDVLEEIRGRERWSHYFRGFRKPYVHFTPEEYRALAERCGLQIVRMQVNDKAWDFETRAGFAAFGNATFVEWTRLLPGTEWPAFIAEVLDRYAAIAASSPAEANTFKFYQLEVVAQQTPAAT